MMIFDPMTGALHADSGAFIKTVRCPLALKPIQLQRLAGKLDRYCHSCEKTILSVDELSDQEVEEKVSSNYSICIFATSKAKNVVFLKPIGAEGFNYSRLPVIQTMRSLEAMDDAQERGFGLILKSTGENYAHGEEKYIVYRNNSSGKLWWSGDYRSDKPNSSDLGGGLSEWTLLQHWFFSRADRPFPLAAYAIPKDLSVNSKVFLEDLIDDTFQETWNQGNAQRRISCTATWSGADFILDPPDQPMMVG